MNTDKTTVDQKAAEWTQRQKAPHSRLRYELAFNNIQKIINGTNLNILDAGEETLLIQFLWQS